MRSTRFQSFYHRHLFEIVKQRYGDRLNNKELDEVRKSMLPLIEAAEQLRLVKLDPSEEPSSVFAPYRGVDQT